MSYSNRDPDPIAPVSLPAGHPDAAPVKTPTDARQGFMLGRMRYILGISIVLAIVAMVLAYRFSV